MDHLVVLEMVEEDRRDAVRVRGHEDGRAADAVGLHPLDVLEEEIEREHGLGEHLGEVTSTGVPRRHDGRAGFSRR